MALIEMCAQSIAEHQKQPVARLMLTRDLTEYTKALERAEAGLERCNYEKVADRHARCAGDVGRGKG